MKTRKLLAMAGPFHAASALDGQYAKRSEGG